MLVAEVLAHIGRRRHDEFIVRPLGWPGLVALRFGALVDAMTTANLCRCLSHHPDRAEELIVRQLDFDHAPPRRADQFYCAGDGAVPAFYHPAPDRLADFTPRHGASSLRSPTVHLGFFEGERKQASRGWDEDTSTAARNILAMLAVACFLMAVSLLADAIDAPQSIAFVAGETSR